MSYLPCKGLPVVLLTCLGAGCDPAVSWDGGPPQVVSVSATGHDRFFGVAYEPGGGFYAAGVVAEGTDASADYKTVLARFTADGALDKRFGSGGLAVHNAAVGQGGEVARGVVVQRSGKIVVSASVEHAGAADARDRDIALLRWNPDGTLDTGFGQGGVALLDLSPGEVVGEAYVADSAWGLAVYPDDRLLVSAARKRAGGTDTDFAVLRLSADGALDEGFGTDGVAALDINQRSASPRTVTLLPDGGIVVAGYMNEDGVVKPVLFKLTGAGQLDARFGQGGVFSQPVLAAAAEPYAAALQGTALVTAGYGRADPSESLDFLSMRISASGALDPSYGRGGYTRVDVAGFNDNGRSLLVLPDERLMLVGGGRPSEGNVDGMLAVLRADGQPDERFAPGGYRLYDLGGAADMFWAAALSPQRSQVAVVGVRGVASGVPNAGNDDAVVLLLRAD